MVAVLLPFSCPLALIAVRVKYGVSQSPGIVVFVLAPCHSRNMPQCMEIFEGKHEKFEI